MNLQEHLYNADCPACLRGQPHDVEHHNKAVSRANGKYPGPCGCDLCAKKETPMPASTPPNGSPRVTSTDSHALLIAENSRTREALKELYRVFVFVDGPITAPSKQAAIREAAEVLGYR